MGYSLGAQIPTVEVWYKGLGPDPGVNRGVAQGGVWRHEKEARGSRPGIERPCPTESPCKAKGRKAIPSGTEAWRISLWADQMY